MTLRSRLCDTRARLRAFDAEIEGVERELASGAAAERLARARALVRAAAVALSDALGHPLDAAPVADAPDAERAA